MTKYVVLNKPYTARTVVKDKETGELVRELKTHKKGSLVDLNEKQAASLTNIVKLHVLPTEPEKAEVVKEVITPPKTPPAK